MEILEDEDNERPYNVLSFENYKKKRGKKLGLGSMESIAFKNIQSND